MNKVIQLPAAEAQVTQGEIIKLACLAVGGQGGGVLGNWIEDTARNEGYACQATSVAGVAQRVLQSIIWKWHRLTKGRQFSHWLPARAIWISSSVLN